MILSGLFNVIYLLFAGILSTLPASQGFSSSINTAFISLGSYISTYSWLVNVSALTSTVLLVLTFELGMIGFRSALWLIRTIRGS